MPVQSFDDKFLGNAAVPQTGSAGGASPSGPGGRAVGRPGAVSQADGTANLGATAETKHADRSQPSGGKNRIPSTVDRFTDAEV